MSRRTWALASLCLGAVVVLTAGSWWAFASDGESGSREGQAAGAEEAYVAMVARDGPLPTPTATLAPTPTPVPTVDPGPRWEPLGFPVDGSQRVGWVTGEAGGRTIAWGAGPDAETYSREYQPSDDPIEANRGGWNCRVHVAYEGRPAVDWYIPTGTPIYATMDGTARLYAITVSNAFDHYGVAREPYIGYPYAQSTSPFPGPGGGKGVYVEIANGEFITESAHFDLESTLEVVPGGAFVGGYSRDTDYGALFAPMRAFNDATLIAVWTVERGDLIGHSGDAGYSEAPHLHYTIRRSGGGGLLCPTSETGFTDGAWLTRPQVGG